MPDKESGRGKKITPSAVKQYAISRGLRIMQPPNLKAPEFISELRAIEADLFIVIAFRMLPEAVWAMPPLGTFNLHASLLPRYRGAAPINRAVMNGDTTTGVTTFMLKHEIDTGDILQQQAVEILPEENVGDVHDKLMRLGAKLTIDTVDHIIAGDLRPIPQDELIKDIEPLPAPKIFAEDCIIDWSKPAIEVHNLVRGLSPYPAARASLLTSDNSEACLVKIYSTAPIADDSPNTPPGTIIIDSGHMHVVCGDGKWLEIVELQQAGKKRMATADFLRGARLDNPVFMN